MSFVYETQRYKSFNEYSTLVMNGQTDLLQRRLEFAHPVDSAVIGILESASVKSVVNKAVETLVSTDFGMMLSTGITVEPKSFPQAYASLSHCCKVLGIAIPHTIITNEISGLNAMTAGTDDFSFIAISNLIAKLLPMEEQVFIIGHECGHIALGHVVYHTMGHFIGQLGSLIPVIGPLVASTISFPLNAWSRCSEITADRAGFLCSGDLRSSQRALLRLIAGFTDISKVDIDEYIEQSLLSLDNHNIGSYNQFFQTHPLIPKRIKALEYFAKSEMYYSLTGKEKLENKTLYSNEHLNSLVSELLKVL